MIIMLGEGQEFINIQKAIDYFSNIYVGLPESIIRETIIWTMENPNAMPEDWERIDITKPPTMKKDKVVEHVGAVEIVENPSSVPEIPHKPAAYILSEEEAAELKIKIDARDAALEKTNVSS